MAGIGALDFTIPELIPSIGCEQNSWHLYDVFEHTMHVVDNAPRDLIVRLSALFHDVGKPGTTSVGEDGARHFYKHELLSEDLCKTAMTRLKFSGDEIREVALLVALHMRPIECGAPGARRLIRDLGDKFNQWMDLKRADAYGAKHDRDEFEGRMLSFIQLTESERQRLVTNRGRVIAIDGAELMSALKISPSPLVGKLLKALEEKVLDNPELNTKDELIRLAQKLHTEGL
jgi:tRNA nucleotidyltransferase/poly(A) polymerase